MKMLAMHDPKTYKEEILFLNSLPLYEEKLYLRHLTKYELAVINAVRMQGVGFNLRTQMRPIFYTIAKNHGENGKKVDLVDALEEAFIPKLPFNPHRWNKYARMVHALNKRDNTVYFDTERYAGHESPFKENLKVKNRINEKREQSLKRKSLNPPVRVRHERPNDEKFYIRNLYFHLDEKEQELVTAFQIDRQYQKYYKAESQNFDKKYTEEHGSRYSSVAGYHKYWRDKGDHMYTTIIDPLPPYWRWKVTQGDAKRKLNQLSNRDCIAY